MEMLSLFKLIIVNNQIGSVGIQKYLSGTRNRLQALNSPIHMGNF